MAVVIDDYEMGITHVIRGADHISNTPRQILILEALGFPRPQYAHNPLIDDEHRAKLSKRTGTATRVMDYHDEGFLPEALINYLALLGWNPGTPKEYLSIAELVETFSLERIQKGSAAWNREKQLSVNQYWMRQLSEDDFVKNLNVEHKTSPAIVKLLKERAKTFKEAREMLSGELQCLFGEPALSKYQLVAKEPKDRPNMTNGALESLSEAIKALPEGVSAEEAKEAIMPLADAEEAKGKGGRGAVLWPLRYALSGQERSPEPFTLISILGVEESISRVRKAIELL
jgi:glutamyl/glutaminyl-tRNA synthetase